MITIRHSLIAVLLLLLNNTYAQQETNALTQSADTCVPATVDDYNRLVKYFMQEKADVKSLLKFDLMQYALLRPNIAYETRIKNNLNAEFFFLFEMIDLFGLRDYTQLQMQLFVLTSDFKYYHNTKSRIEKGKNTNGFSANYFSFGAGTYIFIYDNWNCRINNDGKLIRDNFFIINNHPHLPYNTPKDKSNKIVWRNKKYDPNESIAFVRVGYGIQRRVGNIGYVATDFNFGFGTNMDFSRLYLMPEFSIKAGLAISTSKRNKHKK